MKWFYSIRETPKSLVGIRTNSLEEVPTCFVFLVPKPGDDASLFPGANVSIVRRLLKNNPADAGLRNHAHTFLSTYLLKVGDELYSRWKRSVNWSINLKIRNERKRYVS